ncbi:MAG: ABC transporter ATP-binding protein [Firmicutes bacterium]|nr:ABC transporter ATP-binding protein [Bacillota bacterium]
MIEVRNLTKKYGNNVALDDLSFHVEKGRIYGFLGPNGAGKSTAMNIITGYLAATEGDVLINGHDILKEPRAARSCIGYLPEQPPLYQEMTVREYLDFAAELKGIAKADRSAEVDRAEETLQLQDVEDRLIRNLSKGYKQRVGFAQALLGKPDILVLDEPTVGLDPKQIIEIRSLIRQLGEEHTVILSSHILAEVSEVCDHIMIISKGKLVASSPAEELMQNMQPVTVLKITALAEEETARKVVEALPDVAEYSVRSAAADDAAVEVEIRYDSQEDLRGEIARAFTEAGCTIIQMNRAETTLEDVFLELTAEDPALAEAAEAEDSEEEAAVPEESEPETAAPEEIEQADVPEEEASKEAAETVSEETDGESGKEEEHAGDL